MEATRDAEQPAAASDNDVPVQPALRFTTLVAVARKHKRRRRVTPHPIHQGWAKMKSFHADKVFLTNAKHRTFWVSVLLLQLSNAMVLGAAAYFYLSYNRRDSYLWFIQNNFFFSDSVCFVQEYSVLVALLCLAVCAVFVYWSIEMVCHSLRHCHFRFAAPQLDDFEKDQPNERLLWCSTQPRWWDLRPTLSQCIPQWCQLWCTQCHEVFTSFKKAVGIEGQYFDLRLVADNTVAIAFQSYSAYKSSSKISNVFVSPTYGTLIFCNCLTTPLFQWWFGYDLVTRRFACVVVDLLLVFVWGTILPLWMSLPSLQIFYHQDLRAAALENPENTTREMEHVLIVSMLNMVYTFLPFVSSILNLAELKAVLTVTDRVRSSHIRKRNFTVEPGNVNIMKRRPGWHHEMISRTNDLSRSSARISIFLSLWYVVSICYGISLLSMSIYPSVIARDSTEGQLECIHEVFPWFSSKTACIGRKINCLELGITGKKHELAAFLATFEESSLANLQFTSCSSLELPSAIRNFPNLLTLVLHNSTLVDWDQEAAVDGNSPLQTIRILDIDLQTFPVGLVGNSLSPKLEWIELRNINVTGFIDTVGNSWQHLRYFDCDGCNLTRLPEMVQMMKQLHILALRENQIESISEGALSGPDATLHGIYLDGNPLMSLPEQIWGLTAQCSDFSIQRTNITVSAEYLADQISKDVVIYGFDTPLCNSSEFVSKFVQLSCIEAPY